MAEQGGLEGSQPVDLSKHPSGIVPTLQNIVSTVNLDCKLDLKQIALQARNAEYNPKRFAAVIMRIREPKTTALIFASGKMVCTGAKSEQQSKLAARKYARIIQKLGFPAKFKDFKIQNIVGSCDVKFPIRLEGLAYSHGAFSSYEPELFPGLIYRMKQPKIVLLIFVSGKIVITGAKVRDETYTAFENIYPVLTEFRKNQQCGEFPAFLSGLSSLQVLNRRNNSIERSISDDLSSLSSLRILGRSNNNLIDEIPQSFGNLTGMIDTPDVHHSMLSDTYSFPQNTIPSETMDFAVEIHGSIVNWKNSKRGLSIRNLGLETLDLSHNELVGEIPGTFAKLLELNTLDLSNNKLGGKIPEGLQMDRLVDPNIYANNSGLCGVQIKVPCEEDLLQPPDQSQGMNKKETWFSWIATGIGYPVGFLSSTAVMYVSGYFNITGLYHCGRHCTSPKQCRKNRFRRPPNAT
ncbi:hypothetical protein PTKIN_Ptkin06aG0196200 [Pterospermum kingtungense]